MFLKWSNLFRTERAGGWRPKRVKRIVNFIKIVAWGVEESGESAEGKRNSPSSFILLHITLSPTARPNAETQLLHPHLDKQPHQLGSVHTVPGCVCASSGLLFGDNIRVLLNQVQPVSSTLHMIDMMQKWTMDTNCSCEHFDTITCKYF